MATNLPAIFMLLAFAGLLMTGIPVALAIAAAGFVFGMSEFGTTLFNLVPARMFGVLTNYTLLAIPLFVFMGMLLERSRIAENMLDTVAHLFGKRPGGLVYAIIIVGVLMGAATGIVGATIVTIGMISLPVLIRRGYNKGLACGSICAAGTLGQIIPPSLILILLADIMGESVGTLFAASLFPGLMLAGLYILYIFTVTRMRPEWAPPVPLSERDSISRSELIRRLLFGLLPPLLLVLAVLGSIIGGVAAPTEAASLGALGALILVASFRRLSLKVLIGAMQSTLKTTAMILFILMFAQIFSLAFRGLDGESLIADLMRWVPGGVNGALLFTMLALFFLGFFLDWIEISYIVLPLVLPFFIQAGVDMVWMATLICVVLQTSFLTPPFGWSLFFLKGITPPEISLRDIYVGVVPFILLQLLGLSLVALYPDIALWLPREIGWLK